MQLGDHDHSRIAGEIMAATFAAAVASYVRARKDNPPLSWRWFIALVAEAIVCGLISVGIASLLSWNDPRTIVALSAALGLVGTQLISEALIKLAARKTDKL
jgi:hypothetical protein